MGLLLFLVIIGGLGLMARFASVHARPAPKYAPVKVTALDNAFERFERKARR